MSMTTGKASNRTSSCWGKWVVTKLMWWISRLVIYDVRQPRPWQHVSTMPDCFLEISLVCGRSMTKTETPCVDGWQLLKGAGHELWRQRVAGRVAWCCCLVVSWERVPHQSCLENSQVLKWRTKPWILVGCRFFFCRFQSEFWGVVSVASSSTIL